MNRTAVLRLLLPFVLALSAAGPARSQDGPGGGPGAYKPVPYMPGWDVAWVPTPEVLIEKMLDMARLKPDDVAVDLGSGDGRNVIAAARRGARARGVEFNPKLVELSRHRAAEAGVAARATFVENDMYAADFSDATVLPLFLMTENLDQFVPKFLGLRPGTRIVNNGFGFTHWDYDEIGYVDSEACGQWCVAYLYIVPARVAGVWRTVDGELELSQEFQWLTGTLTRAGRKLPIERGRMQGDVIRFNAGGVRYTARVSGDTMTGEHTGDLPLRWSARR